MRVLPLNLWFTPACHVTAGAIVLERRDSVLDRTTHQVERLGHLGDGIAEGPVYVPGALPGEVVTGHVSAGRLLDLRIVTPSPDRITPPCRHARSCGGCQLQHASDAFVAAWKRDVVLTALAAQGLQGEVSLPLTSPAQSRRRAVFSVRRTKKGALAGFHQKSSDVVVEVPDCRVVDPRLSGALPFVQALAVLAGSRKGEMSVSVTTSQDGLDVDVRGAKPADAQVQVNLADLARTHDIARIGWEGEAILTRRAPRQLFDGITVIPPPGAFLQATRDGEISLRAVVQTVTQGAARIVDLFAGCGTFGLPLSRTAQVHAVEGDATMLQTLDQAWRQASGLKHVTHAARDLFRNPLLPDDLARFDAAVLDPPRAGAEAQVAQLAKAKVPRIAYVSCNPVSFARDCAVLVAAGYRMGPVTVVDQFRWSTHVELVAGLTLE